MLRSTRKVTLVALPAFLSIPVLHKNAHTSAHLTTIEISSAEAAALFCAQRFHTFFLPRRGGCWGGRTGGFLWVKSSKSFVRWSLMYCTLSASLGLKCRKESLEGCVQLLDADSFTPDRVKKQEHLSKAS